MPGLNPGGGMPGGGMPGRKPGGGMPGGGMPGGPDQGMNPGQVQRPCSKLSDKGKRNKARCSHRQSLTAHHSRGRHSGSGGRRAHHGRG